MTKGQDKIAQASFNQAVMGGQFLINGFMPTYSRFGSDNPQKNLYWMEAYQHMFDVTSSLFEWEGLDDLFEDAPYGDIGQWIEKAILNSWGQLVVFPDDVGNPQIAIASPTSLSSRNFFYQISDVQPIMPDGTTSSKMVKICGPEQNGVLIENKQYAGMSDPIIMDIEASLISEIRLSQNTNLLATRNPTVIYSTMWNKEDGKSIEKAMKEGQPIVSMTKGPSKNLSQTEPDITVGQLNPATNYNFNIMNESLVTVYAQAFAKLGVDAGAAMAKKERMVADETEALKSQVQGILGSKLAARQYAADKINELFGTNVSVKLRNPEVLEDINNTEDFERATVKNGSKMTNESSDVDEGGEEDE